MDAKIKYVKIKLGDKTIKLTIDEVKKLKQELLKLMPEPDYFPYWYSNTWWCYNCNKVHYNWEFCPNAYQLSYTDSETTVYVNNI